MRDVLQNVRQIVSVVALAVADIVVDPDVSHVMEIVQVAAQPVLDVLVVVAVPEHVAPRVVLHVELHVIRIAHLNAHRLVQMNVAIHVHVDVQMIVRVRVKLNVLMYALITAPKRVKTHAPVVLALALVIARLIAVMGVNQNAPEDAQKHVRMGAPVHAQDAKTVAPMGVTRHAMVV